MLEDPALPSSGTLVASSSKQHSLPLVSASPWFWLSESRVRTARYICQWLHHAQD